MVVMPPSAEIRYRQHRLVAYILGSIVALCVVASLFANDRDGNPLHSNMKFWLGVSCLFVVAQMDWSRPAAVVSSTRLSLYPTLAARPVVIELVDVDAATANVLDFRFTMRGGAVVTVPAARFSSLSERMFRQDLAEFCRQRVWPGTYAA